MKIIPKFQRGGGFEALFTTYVPVQSPQQTRSVQTSQSERSSRQDSDDNKGKFTEKDFFSMLKDIDGLPNEMQSIASNLLDILSGIIDFLVGIFTGDWEQAWRGIEKIVDGVVGVIGDLFNGLWDLLCAGFEGVYKFIGGIFEGIGNLIGNVVDWMIKRFQDGLNSIKRAWSGLKSWFSDLFNGICDVFRNVGRKIGDAVSGAFKAVINGALNMVEKTINSGIKLINNAIWVINKIPGVNISKISLVSFPRLARGGIVDGPRTVTVGEQGKEAIVPLENTAFVTILANAISDGIAKKLNVNNNNQNVGPINVHLDLDGRTFGKVAIDNINKYQDLAGRTLLRFQESLITLLFFIKLYKG